MRSPPSASSHKTTIKSHDAPTVVALVVLAKAHGFPALRKASQALSILKQAYTLNPSTLRYIGQVMAAEHTDISEVNYALTQLKIESAGIPEKMHAMLSCLMDLAVDDTRQPTQAMEASSMKVLQQVAEKLGYGADDFAALATVKGFLPEALYDPYQILGLPTGASLEAATKAYKKLVQEFHPDRWQGKNRFAVQRAQEQTVLINDAYSKIKKAAGMAGRA